MAKKRKFLSFFIQKIIVFLQLTCNSKLTRRSHIVIFLHTMLNMLINLLAISKISEKRALELKFEFDFPEVTESDLDL